jgi:energy-coupling factor transporter ATP-binding protein EcfA2
MLWVDKHRPKTMKDLDYHVELSKSLNSMVERGDFPHILFYGPSGAGKKTRVLALLRDIYGPAIDKVKVEHKQFKVGSTTVEVPILSSAHHLELNPGDAGNRDRDVVQELIKEIAASAPLPTSSSGNAADWKPFKVVVLNEVDNLSKDAQHALRRTMEKCVRRGAPRALARDPRLFRSQRAHPSSRTRPRTSSGHRHASRPHPIPRARIAPRAQVHRHLPHHDDVQQRVPGDRAGSLALPVRAHRRADASADRAGAASHGAQGVAYTAAAVRREARRDCARQPAQGAADARGCAGEHRAPSALCARTRARAATRADERRPVERVCADRSPAAPPARAPARAAVQVSQYPFDPNQQVKQADWEKYVDDIAKDCAGEQSPRRLLQVRNKLYDLLAHCIPPDMIMEALTRSLLARLRNEPPVLQMEVLYTAAMYEHRMLSGSKAIFHIEAFVAKFMAIYKRHMVAMFSNQ